MVAAETPESRRLWESRFREAINARNAARSDAQLAEIETRKGLR
jgi:hypothetical protein